MAAVMEREDVEAGVVGGAPEVKERLKVFMADVGAGLGRSEQRRCAGVYARGLLEAGQRKSLEPVVARLGEDGDYEALQHFLADSPWDPVLVQRAVAERLAPEIGVQAWVIDGTGVPKDGKHSPGSSVSIPGRWGRSVTVRSRCRCTRSVSVGRCRLTGRCTCPRTGALIRRVGARRRSLRGSSLRPSPSWLPG